MSIHDRPSLAATALRDLRVPLSASFRMRRPRAGFCHAGWCQQCRVKLSDGRVVLACLTPDDAKVRIDATVAGRWVGEIASHLPPWFYEHRLLRPRALRQFYLERLRRLSGAPRAHESLARLDADYAELECDTLVVGAGAAGLEAASTAATPGNRVVLVDAERCGGRMRWRKDKAQDLSRAIQAARAAGVEIREGVTCVGLYRDPSRALCALQTGSMVIRFSNLVLATGAYDRLPAFERNDLPGIIGVRAFERLAAQSMIPKGARIGVWGDDHGVSCALVAASASALEIGWAACPSAMSGVRRPFAGARVERAWGGRRLRAVTVGPHRRVPCDILVVAFSQPAYELAAQAGVTPLLAGDPPTLHLPSISQDGVACVGELAANAATQSAAARAPDDALVCLCEDVRAVDVRAAIADGYDDVELLKRHTGAGTGPCQGKLCHGEMLQCLRAAGRETRLPTMRPLTRPVPLHCFARKP